MALSRDDVRAVRPRTYVAKDFQTLRAQLLEYARQHYPNRIRDFSESSLGGLFLDMAAMIGDNFSFYIDHQHGELDPNTAVETGNIERMLRAEGVPIVGAAPALAPVTIFVQVPASSEDNTLVPLEDALPNIKAGSLFTSDSGVNFILLEDVDFVKKKADGSYVADVRVSQKTSTGVPTFFVLAAHGLCVSGRETTEDVAISSTFVPFRKVTLTNPNVSEIVSVTDSSGNVYYRVTALSHDVVYKNVLNTALDNDIVKDAMKVVPAPFRYTAATELSSRKTVLTFGGGGADTLEDDVIPDPADFAIAFPYTKTFSRVPVNPQSLLQTKTLGVAATSTTLKITYRYGGGLDHNVGPGTIRNVKTLNMYFAGDVTAAQAGIVRDSIEVSNALRGAGGEDAPSPADLKLLIPSIRSSQERIVTREDLIARVYTMPANFGRVFRAAVRSNPNNPLATQLFIVSRGSDKKLTTSSDTLKKNLRTYLNPYRMISDAIDVLDARIINLRLTFDVLIDPSLNKSTVLQAILTKLQTELDVKNFHIDQPIVLSDLTNTIFSTRGVVSVNKLTFDNIVGIHGDKTYSDNVFDTSSNMKKGILFPSSGGIFEFRFLEVDVIGKAS